MNAARAELPVPVHNPFSTTRVRPGAIAFRFPVGESAERLAARLVASECRGQIVGAHGSGKSTLLSTLVSALEARGLHIARYELHNGERRLPAPLPTAHGDGSKTIVVIDGYEQLAAWHAWHIGRICQRRGHGLLVTMHRAGRLPTLYETRPQLAMVQEIVAELLAASDNRIAPADVERLFARHAADVRETLFGLYRLIEVRRRSL